MARSPTTPAPSCPLLCCTRVWTRSSFSWYGGLLVRRRLPWSDWTTGRGLLSERERLSRCSPAGRFDGSLSCMARNHEHCQTRQAASVVIEVLLRTDNCPLFLPALLPVRQHLA